MHQRSISATWVRGLVDALACSGLDVDSLCREIGLDIQALASTNTGCPTEKLSLFWELAEARSGNPAIGLSSHHTVRPASFEVVGYAMMSSANLSAGLERLVRFMRIICDASTLTLSQQGEGCRVTLEIFGGGRPVPRQRFESALLILLTFCRWMTARELQPLVVELTQHTPANVQSYSDVFRCPLLFSAATNCIVFSRADLALPLPTSNSMMADLLDRFAGQRVDQMESTQVSAQVRELIMRKLPDGEPGRDDIAGMLCVSERTLQRQLQKEGASFHQLLDHTRRELAHRYLGQHHISFAEAAYLLGFSEQSNFTRACKRWFQLSPGRYRAHIASELVGSHLRTEEAPRPGLFVAHEPLRGYP